VVDRVISVRLEIEVARARRDAKAAEASFRGIATAAETAGRSDKSMQRLSTATKGARTELAAVGGLSSRLGGVTASLKGMAAAGAAVAALSIFKTVIDEAREAERVGRKTEAVIASTGGQANVTAGQVSTLADRLSKLAGVDDEVIAQGENVLLTFTKVRNETGKGNDIFDQAATVALDMAAALDKTGDSGAEMQANVIRIGKALNDPIKGMTALTKVGVSFTSSQRAQVAAMVESGDVLGAQKLILQELQTEFGGMAEASADSIGKAQVSWANFAEAVGQKVMPAVTAVSNWALNTGVPALGQVADVVGNVVGPAFRGLLSAGQGIVGLWQSLPGPIQAGAIAMGVWALAGDRVTGIFSRAAAPLKNFSDQVRAQPADLTRLGASVAVLESNIPAISRMGTAFRSAKGEASGFGGTLRGVASAGFSGLKAAAGGLMGLLGGPWGLALAGAAALLAWLAGRSAEAEQKQRKLAEAGKSVAQAIAEQNGEYNKTTRQAAAKAAEDEGLLKIADELGISLPRVTNAVEGQGNAYAGLKAELEGVLAGKREELEQAKAVRGSGEKQAQIQAEIDQYQALLTGVNGLVSGRDSEYAANKRVASGSGELIAAEGAVAGATDGATTAVEEQKQAVDNLLSSLRTYWSESAAAVENQIAWEEQWDALSQSIRENGTSLDINTLKGRNNANALGALIKTSQNMMATDIQAGMALDVASGKHVRRTNTLIQEARRAGMNSRAVADLIGKYNGVPGNVTTWLAQKGLGPVRQNLSWLTAIQTLLKDGIEATPGAIAARMRKASGYTSSGNEDYAGGRATGGLIRGPGGPTSDKAGLFRLSNKEFVQQAAATDYYGVGFMEALNERRIPREAFPGFARGGLVAPYPVDVSNTWMPTKQQVEDAFYRTHPELAKVGKMKSWAQAQAGKRYSWGAVGPGAYDCSGLVGNLYAISRGLSQYRRYFTTASMGPGKFGMASGPGKVTVYLGNGHTAANVGGLHAEAYGGNGVPLAIGRVGTPLSYYHTTMHMTGAGMARGGLVALRSSRRARQLSFLECGWPEPPAGESGQAARMRGSYRRGTNRVPMDGLYQLHRGERVTPAGRRGPDEVVVTLRSDGTPFSDLVIDSLHKADKTGRVHLRVQSR
jgi:hypothetical protein